MEPLQKISFDQFLQYFASVWKQGQHVAIVGPTGRGKTTLASYILDIRDYVVVLAVKRDDDTLYHFTKKFYRTIKKWPPPSGINKIVYWIRPKSIDHLEEQTQKVHHALDVFYTQGGWTVYLDEVGYVAGYLKQAKPVGVLLNQGRSSNLSIVCSMTRPRSTVASIPVETLSQCRHLFFFKYKDLREIETCSEISGMSKKDMIYLQENMDDHDFLYVNEKGHLLVEKIK
jgi:energy-coupling factor transporter ATP-binding protein EcfA2